MQYCLRVLFFITLCTHLLCGQTRFMESLTVENGLSQGMIYDICQTNDGFLWIATKQGLNRYDGYNFKIYAHNPLNPYSIAENTVTALYQDHRGWLWLGTQSKGIDLYHPPSNRFYHFPLNFGSLKPTISLEVRRITETANGIYLAMADNVVHIKLPDEWTTQLPDEPNLAQYAQLTLFSAEQIGQIGQEAELRVAALVGKPNGNAWLYSNQQMYELIPQNGQAQIQPLSPKQVNQLTPPNVWGDIRNGLLYFANGKPALPALPPDLIINTSAIKYTNQNTCWIALNNKLWCLQNNELPNFNAPHWEIDTDISAIATDRNGNIWIGTKGYGLRKINPKRKLFHHGAAGHSIWGIWQDKQGRYYCKVINQVYEYNPITGTLNAQTAFDGKPKRILDMSIDPQGNYWLLGRYEPEQTSELRYYNPQTKQAVAYPFPFETTSGTSGNNAPEQWFKSFPHARILQAKSGKLWIVGLDCGLIGFDPKIGRFDMFSYAAVFGDIAPTVQPLALVEDGNGILWIGTQHGLVKCTPQAQYFTFERIQAGANSLNNNSVACLLPDPQQPQQILWIGTKGGGINRLHLQTGIVQTITMQDGLPDNVVYGILPGKENEFWCSTNRGLAKLSINPQGLPQNITAFTAAQGLQHNEFNTQAYFKTDKGELLFGGVNGINRFYPQAVLPDTLPPPVYIVGLRINHQPADFGSPNSPLAAPLEITRQLRLLYEQNNFSVEFAALDFTDPAKNRYRYQLIGADPHWVETGTYHFAHFTHLQPGHYTLLVEGSNGEGAWHSIANPVSIVVLPPWWRTTWAYLIYFSIAIGILWQGYRFQIRRIKMNEQLAFERRETERIKALEQMKTNFFSNVTHEFRTPITLMLEPLRQLLKNPDDPNRIGKIQLAEKNSRQLLQLVNQLLDMAKLESGSMTLDLRQTDVTQLLHDVYNQFMPLAQHHQQQLSLHITPPIDPFYFDAAKVELILNNLLSNACKFTPANGSITIACQTATLPHTQTPAVQISIADSGIGIPPESLPKIFDRFYQVNAQHNQAGTGIGLALTKELIELMGGSIQVNSQPNKGATFTFFLPIISQPNNQLTPHPDITQTNTLKPDIDKPLLQPLLNGNSQNGQEYPIALVIEDNPELRSFICHSIGANWQIYQAQNGQEGIDIALEILPDIIISDLMMPLKDGYAVCNELKNNQLTAHIPIILLTAKSAMEAKIQGLQTGADDYLTKPFNTDELLARMTNLIELRKRLSQKYAQQQLTHSPPNEALQNEKPEPLLSNHDQEFLNQFTALIEQNLKDENITIEDLAQKMLISRVQLHRKLKAITDQNASDFVRNYRLDRAMTMLQNKEGLVYEISDRVGFTNEKYFARAFKEKFGISPSQV